jgi:hypothetical protein
MSFILSGTIRPVALPTQDDDTYEGVMALLSGYGSTSNSKCVDAFNLYSNYKELLLFSQCQMDLIEVTQNYII